VINNRRREILNEINKKFYNNEYEYTDIDWSIKSILAANIDEHFSERYADVTLSGIKVKNC
jgi:hypothetical protein